MCIHACPQYAQKVVIMYLYIMSVCVLNQQCCGSTMTDILYLNIAHVFTAVLHTISHAYTGWSEEDSGAEEGRGGAGLSNRGIMYMYMYM